MPTPTVPNIGTKGDTALTTGLAIVFAYLPNFLNASPSFAFSGLSILSAVVTPGAFFKSSKSIFFLPNAISSSACSFVILDKSNSPSSLP